jgi:hypothetical protein
VTPDESENADATLHGTILKESVAPLTYNSSTQQSSSFLITMVVSVTLNGRDGEILYENKNPAALERLSREFARQLVADVLEGF